MNEPVTTAVSFHIFNRPDTTSRVFERIRAARPRVLFVVADGPREAHPADKENCRATRRIIDEVDWKCEVLRNYSEVNMGSYKRNSSGLSWLFDNVEEAIVLEDDCVPHPTFFRFCEELLARYRNDNRIGAIGGNNFLKRPHHGHYSYIFSKFPLLWGWAGWRRTWKLIDRKMAYWPEFRKYGLRCCFPDRRLRGYWDNTIFQAIYEKKKKPAWDYEFMLTCFMQNMLTIIPSVNLVTNIGFGDNGTNCLNPNDMAANIPCRPMEFPLVHPAYIIADCDADTEMHFNRFDVQWNENKIVNIGRKMRLLIGLIGRVL